MMSLLLIGLLILFLFLRMPVAISMGLSSIIYLLINIMLGGTIPLTTAVQRMVIGVDSFPLMAIPFFILAGELMNTGGVTNRLLNLAMSLVRHIKGGLAQVSILVSVLFASMSGSSIASAMIFGKMMIPKMEKDGYDKGFAAAVIATASTLGPIIPPSIIMVIYGVMANVSIASMFIAGVVPGILLAGSLMIVSYIVSKKNKYPTYERANKEFIVDSTKKAFLPLLMPIILIGGILSGIFTPTEAAVVAALYGLILGFAYKELKLKDLLLIGKNTASTTASIMFIIATASLFGWILTIERAPQILAQFMLSLTDNKYIILLILMLILLILGMFMETTAIIIMTVPIFLPIINQLGIDPVHFGIAMLLNVMIGTVTPPVGVLMFVVNNIAKIGMKEFIKAVQPFYIAFLVVLLLALFIPQISLFLPEILMNK